MSDRLHPTGVPPTPTPEAPRLCGGNCGFWGNPKQNGLCSKCFKLSLAASQPAPESPSTSESHTSHTSHSLIPLTPNTLPVETPSSTSTPEMSLDMECKNDVTAPITSFTVPITDANGDGAIEDAVPVTVTETLPTLTPAPLLVASSPDGTPPTESKEGEKKVRMRCGVCKKKVSAFSYFTCSCSGDVMFCSAHRYPHSHNCTDNLKQKQQDKLTKANPVVAPSAFRGDKI